MRSFNTAVRVGLLVAALGFTTLSAQGDTSTEEKTSRDPLMRLWEKVRAGTVHLDSSSDLVFLRSLLRELDIPLESQVLVFSKTSLQKSLIGPNRPRAIYYNEECYVGWVQGGAIEIVSTDPERGLQYYLIDRPFTRGTGPVLAKNNECLSCHAGGNLQMQSVHVTDSGYPMGGEDRFVTTYESPLSERWGGWYVTGKHGGDLHMGNVITGMTARGVFHDREKGANFTSLRDCFPTAAYPTDTSDIVSLMVLEHQYLMHNTLVDAGKAVRRWLTRQADGSQAASSGDTHRVIAKHAQNIVRRLLFCDEYALSKDGVSGSADFQESFRRNRRLASDSTSLKDFDLRDRIFKHRCSHMIYSESFSGLPEPLKDAVLHQLGSILRGEDLSGAYEHLDAKERAQIMKILLDTLPEARAAWHATDRSEKPQQDATLSGS
jgi:hypothetical protein